MNQYKDMSTEMTDAELAQVHGGGWLSDTWNKIKEAITDIIKGPFPKPKPIPIPTPRPRPWPPILN